MTNGYTTAQAAVELGVTTSTVIKWVEKGLVLCTKTLGGHRRISKDELVRVKIKMGLEI